MAEPPQKLSYLTKLSPWRVALLYAVVSALWYLLSDLLLDLKHTGLATRADVIADWIYVAVTAGVLYLALKQQRQQYAKAQDNLRASEERYRYLFERNPYPLWMVDAETLRFLAVNEAMVAKYGYTREELLSMTVCDIRPPEEVPRFLEYVARRPPASLNNFGVWRHQRKDGSVMDMEVVSQGFSLHGQTIRLNSGIDVTERLRAEEKLRQSERQMQSILDQLEDIVWSADLEGRLIYANAALRHIYQRPPQDFLAHSNLWFEVIHPDDQAQVAASQEQLLTAGEAGYEYRILRPDGAVRWLAERVRLVTDARGHPLRRDGITSDITERKQTEQQLQSSHQQLRALAARLNVVRETESRRIAREVHDEFGQALTALLFDLSWLEERLKEQEQVAWASALAQKVQNSSRTARQMVGTVRRIARELRPELLDDFGLVAALEWQSEKFQENTGIVCEFLATTEQEEFPRDSAIAIFRIAQEALTNVARHSQATSVNIVLEDDDAHLILQVADNGHGFAPNGLSAQHSLGLLGMKERAVLLQGELNIASTPGAGTRVTARIPLT